MAGLGDALYASVGVGDPRAEGSVRLSDAASVAAMRLRTLTGRCVDELCVPADASWPFLRLAIRNAPGRNRDAREVPNDHEYRSQTCVPAGWETSCRGAGLLHSFPGVGILRRNFEPKGLC